MNTDIFIHILVARQARHARLAIAGAVPEVTAEVGHQVTPRGVHQQLAGR